MMWSNVKNKELQERARAVIPNGMYGHEAAHFITDDHPQFFARAQGGHIWDVDGNEYIDLMCAFGPNLLGYSHPEVDKAAIDQIRLGDTMTGPGAVMVELAERLTSMISHADWAMFCKNGTDATTMAVTTARAHTGKKKILLASGVYHGAAPWCVPFKGGILAEQRAHQIYYQYNDVESLEAAVREADGDIAGVFATPFLHEAFANQELVNPEYARRCRQICDETNALLVVDEVRTGFRLGRDSSWEEVQVRPDLSCWGKVLANGHAISALLGADAAKQAASEIFVTGSFWFSAAPMAAAMKTLELISTTKYLEDTIRVGKLLREGLAEQSARHDFELVQSGPVQMPQFLFAGDADFRIGNAWTSAALKKGAYIHPWHNMFICGAHTEDDAAGILEATEFAFRWVKKNWSSLSPNMNLMKMLASAKA